MSDSGSWVMCVVCGVFVPFTVLLHFYHLRRFMEVRELRKKGELCIDASLSRPQKWKSLSGRTEDTQTHYCSSLHIPIKDTKSGLNHTVTVDEWDISEQEYDKVVSCLRRGQEYSVAVVYDPLNPSKVVFKSRLDEMCNHKHYVTYLLNERHFLFGWTMFVCLFTLSMVILYLSPVQDVIIACLAVLVCPLGRLYFWRRSFIQSKTKQSNQTQVIPVESEQP